MNNATRSKFAVLVFSAALLATSPAAVSDDLSADGAPDVPRLQIFRSTEISAADALREIEGFETRSAIETGILTAQQTQSADRLSRVKQLFGLGHASKLQVELAEMDLEEIACRVKAEQHFGELVKNLHALLTPESFINSPVEEKMPKSPEFQVRIPGLSLRAGGEDLFTVRMPAKAETARAAKNYTAARLTGSFAIPYRDPVGDYFEERHETLSGISSARKSELDRSRFYVTTIRNLELLGDHHLAARWRQGERIGKYSDEVEKQEEGGAAPARTFAGSRDSFWLFGDGEAVARPAAPVSELSIALAGQKADSNHAIDLATSNVEKIQRRYERLVTLQAKGYASPAEVREVKLQFDLASYQLMKERAEQEVAKRELAQLKIAAAGPSPDTSTRSLPEANGITAGSAKSWLTWLIEGPTTDSAELLRFLPLVEERFQAAAECESAAKRLDYEQRQNSLYLRLKSLFASERETGQERVIHQNANYSKVREGEQLAVLKLRQWALRNVHRDETSIAPSPETMAGVMSAGKEVSVAKSDVAKIELAQLRAKYLFDLDYLDRLREVQEKGAATSYEIKRAENEMLRSKGLVLSALRNFKIEEQEATFVRVLYESGSMSYNERGLEITRFMPEAVDELQKLAILKDGVDEGKALYYETQLSDAEALTSQLNRLISKGYASPVELERATVKRKVTENRLALEKARGAALEHSLSLIKSLEFHPDAEKISVPLPEQSL